MGQTKESAQLVIIGQRHGSALHSAPPLLNLALQPLC